jgi:hypothetical protein
VPAAYLAGQVVVPVLSPSRARRPTRGSHTLKVSAARLRERKQWMMRMVRRRLAVGTVLPPPSAPLATHRGHPPLEPVNNMGPLRAEQVIRRIGSGGSVRARLTRRAVAAGDRKSGAVRRVDGGQNNLQIRPYIGSQLFSAIQIFAHNPLI